MKTLFAQGFGVSGLAALVMFTAVDADAAVRSFAATECVADPGDPRTMPTPRPVQPTYTIYDKGQLANFNSGTLTLNCPVVSDTSIAARFANWAHVYGWSTGSGSITAKACKTSTSGAAASCAGSGTVSSGSGAVDLQVNPQVGGFGWNGTDFDSYYLVVDYTQNASIFGYAFTTP